MSIVVNDENWQDVVKESVSRGFTAGCLPRKTQIGELAFATVYAEHVPLIPESQWKDRIKEMTAAGAFIGQRFKFDPKLNYQNGFGYCWAYSLAQAVMGKRGQQGLPFVQLSPESLAEDVGYRNAGNMLDSALAYAAKNGIATRDFVPQFKINPKDWKEGWKEDRKNYIPLEWFDLGGKDVWAETVTALLSGDGCFIGLDWWRHAVWYDMLGINDKGQIGVHTPNSHGEGNDVWLFGSKAVPSMGSFVLRSITFSGTL